MLNTIKISLPPIVRLYLSTILITKLDIMLRWSITFVVIALVAAILGFGGIAGAAAGIAKILFFVFLVLFVISLLTRGARRY